MKMKMKRMRMRMAPADSSSVNQSCTGDDAPHFPFDAHAPESDDLRVLQSRHRQEIVAPSTFDLRVENGAEVAQRVRELQVEVARANQRLRVGLALMVVLLVLIAVGLVWIEGGLRLRHRIQQVETAQQEQEGAEAQSTVARVSDRDTKEDSRRVIAPVNATQESAPPQNPPHQDTP